MREYRTLGLRLGLICLVCVMALAAVNAWTAPIIEANKGGGGNAGPGTITATASGFSGGEVSVTVTFNADGTIAAVTADLSTQTPGIGDQAGKPEFLDQFVGKTSADGVDTISGATYSSTAVIEAINKACEQFAAGGGSAASGNVITETAAGFSGGDVIVTVTFNADGTIASVTADLSTQTPGIGDQAGKPEFLDQFVGKTGAEGVDTITGATYSSSAVIEAVEKACAKFNGK
ncbi:MAG: FMN-binding protein [Christensenellales bacterium]|jgi:Na+-translocating ferredoxin:NAD+ oxidoreductase RnfG subunit